MKGPSCLRAMRLLERRASGLGGADQLALEEHLSSCDACAEEAALLQRIQATVAAMPTDLGASRRSRIIGRALREGAREGARTVPPRLSPRWWALGAAGAVAAAALIAWVVVPGFSSSTEMGVSERSADGEAAIASDRVAHPSVLEAEGDRVLSGVVRSDRGELATGDAIPGEGELLAAKEATLALGHGSVVLEGGARVAWDPPSSTLLLRDGRAEVDVSPEAHRAFRVVTRRFMVVVLGTRFVVDNGGVRVVRGVVRVLSPDGQLLLDRLEAGQTWEAPSVHARGAPPAASDAPGAHDEPAVVASAPAETAPRRPSAAEARDLLGRARQLLASGEHTAALAVVDDAISHPHGPREAAEAATLRAEHAALTGDPAGAIAQYREVAERYPRLGAGESALFAAATMAARTGDRDLARSLYTEYLSRYPLGRFRTEVLRRTEREE